MNRYDEKTYPEYLEACLASCTCRKTIWKLYAMTPPNGRFTVQAVSESSDTILDSVSFRKDDENGKEAGEERLRALIAKIYSIHGKSYPYPRIACEFLYGFGIEYRIRVYVEE